MIYGQAGKHEIGIPPFPGQWRTKVLNEVIGAIGISRSGFKTGRLLFLSLAPSFQ
jgi:hypothetical protein